MSCDGNISQSARGWSTAANLKLQSVLPQVREGFKSRAAHRNQYIARAPLISEVRIRGSRSSFANFGIGALVMSNVREPMIQPISILALRPTQMTVGMREVKEKRKRWRDKGSKKKQEETLGKHM